MIPYLFTFRGQINRLPFFFFTALAVIMMAVFENSKTSNIALQGFLFILFIAMYLIWISALVRRCRDLGISLLWLLVLLIPFLNILLLLPLLLSPGWDKKTGTKNLLAILKGLAESDGKINTREILAFETIWKNNLDEKIYLRAIEQFANGRLNPFKNYEHYVDKFKKEHGKDTDKVYAAFNMLQLIAEADGEINKYEASRINRFIDKLGLESMLPPGFSAVIGMAAKLAKADGTIDKKEIAIISQFIKQMQFSSEQRDIVIREFKSANKNSKTFEDYLHEFSRVLDGQRDIFEMVFGLLLDIALADGGISSEEANMLDKAAKVLNIESEKCPIPNDNDMEKLYAQILGLSENYSLEDVKRQYKEIIIKNHPDRVAGLSDAIRQAAERESKKINEAYDYFKRKFN